MIFWVRYEQLIMGQCWDSLLKSSDMGVVIEIRSEVGKVVL